MAVHSNSTLAIDATPTTMPLRDCESDPERLKRTPEHLAQPYRLFEMEQRTAIE